MLPRHATPILRELARGFPVVAITGPRQSGKTTLARQTFPQLPYVNLEDLDTRGLALSDPRRFLARHADGAVFDEVQRAPALMSYLLDVADADARMGRFVLTGSQQFGLMDRITQSLAGRVGMLTLLPLGNAELAAAEPPARAAKAADLEQRLWRGGFPALYAQHRHVQPAQWFAAYVATYIERDVRQVLNVGNLLTFQRFVSMCAARSGQLLNLHSLASDCGISQPTARQWLTVLQASHLVTLLPPHFRNFGKRLVKTPKLYFLDSGLLCHLLRIASPDDLHAHAMRGAVFETWVVGETLKHRHNLGLPADLYFWRDNHGLEIDLVFEHGSRLHAVECKSGTTYSPSWLEPARKWRALVGAAAADPVLVYGGDQGHRGADDEVIGWRSVGR
ncbi:MAG: ATPase AAA [Methylibium sp. NZG]|nr:MAG: ATPase AAA [Methylibium sp. NZG]